MFDFLHELRKKRNEFPANNYNTIRLNTSSSGQFVMISFEWIQEDRKIYQIFVNDNNNCYDHFQIPYRYSNTHWYGTKFVQQSVNETKCNIIIPFPQ